MDEDPSMWRVPNRCQAFPKSADPVSPINAFDHNDVGRSCRIRSAEFKRWSTNWILFLQKVDIQTTSTYASFMICTRVFITSRGWNMTAGIVPLRDPMRNELTTFDSIIVLTSSGTSQTLFLVGNLLDRAVQWHAPHCLVTENSVRTKMRVFARPQSLLHRINLPYTFRDVSNTSGW